MTNIYNRLSERERRKHLRNNMPSAEVIVWSRLQRRQIHGCKFRRQFSVGPYVLDFYSAELKLAIEIDGDSHFQAGAETYDKARQISIEQLGVKFLRFTNIDVYKNLKGVFESISETIQEMKRDKASAQQTPCVQQQDASPLTKGDKKQ
ncbi:MAG: endonuclease domain-containing protein [Ignavibacteriae bacterium]|nr:endonuclease domain-containing protein [Ignavibacteria bacterium]MBI3363864.1 endonuclease domain-containing protein [Ignavibacteriota bacterium]